MAGNDYPQAPLRPDRWQCGAHSVEDPYLYLTNGKDPEVLGWVAQENLYTDQWFEATPIQERIRFLKEKKASPNYSSFAPMGTRIYAGCTGADGKHSAVVLSEDFSHCETLLDSAAMGERMQVFGVVPCPADEQVAAFGALKHGAPRLTVVIRDIKAQKTLAELDGTFFYTWSADGTYLYSSTVSQRADGTTENCVIRWNRSTGETETVYTWPGHAVFLEPGAAPGGEMFIHVHQNYHDVVMIHLTPDGKATQVFPENGAQTIYLGTIGSRHYFFTDENAPLGRVLAVEADQLGQGYQEVVPQSQKPLEGAGVVGGKLLLVYLEDASCTAQVHDAQGSFVRALALPDPIGTLSCSKPISGSQPGSSVVYLGYESFTCPPCVLRCDVDTGDVQVVYRTGEPREDILVQRRFVTSRDGQRILAFLVYRKDLEPNGAIPTLMYGYGGYSSSQLPWYNNPFIGLDIPDWTDRGGLYVHCILRGGAEYGSAWHDAGCGLQKKNVFFDFIDLARAVMDDGWTDPSHTAICGGSNGGLLTTALLTMEPSLWGCVIASVPHTDMLHFSCDDRGPMYVTEYGDPRTEAFFDYMKSYSPYHNIHTGTAYPPVYIQTGEMDNNVPPYHGKKFAAALQQATTGGPVLLRVLPYGSHDRGTGEYFYRTTAEMQTFIERHLGMEK